MLHIILVIAGFILAGVACTGFWQGLKLKPNDNPGFSQRKPLADVTVRPVASLS
jgi:hypothetical protein